MGQGSRIENSVIMISLLEQEIDADIGEQLRIRRIIKTVGDIRHQQLLELRYLDGKTWEQVAASMGLSREWVGKLNKKVLSSL